MLLSSLPCSSDSGLRPRLATLVKITDPRQKQSGTSGFMLELSDTEIPASFGASRGLTSPIIVVMLSVVGVCLASDAFFPCVLLMWSTC